MIITVIGLGLIGGSFAKSLKESDDKYHFIGCDQSSKNEERALKLGLVHECLPFTEAIHKSQVILMAIPVDVIAHQLPLVLEEIRQDQLVIDFGSTKWQIAQSVFSHTKRSNYLAAHPMAGTENTGPDAALSGLYQDKIMIICDAKATDKEMLKIGIGLFEKLGSDIVYMDSKAHDEHIAYVSHLSHVSSFMLGLTVLEKEKDEKNIFNMAGSGFRSTVRLAMSSPEMWSPIFLQNKENIKLALSQYINHLKEFETALTNNNGDSLMDFMRQANHIKKVLDK